jgi:hypothetical protein
MAQTLQIIYKSTTLDLNTGAYRLADGFFPNNQAERFDILLVTSTLALLETALSALRLMRLYAEQNKNEPDPAYLVYSPDSTATLMRTRIVKCNLLYENRYLHRRNRIRAKVGVALEHDPFWEAATETELSLTSSEGSGTGGVTIYNHWGATHKNYVAIAAASAGGDLPTPLRLKIRSAGTSDHIYIGHNWRCDPTNFVPALEGEDGDSTPVDNANASGGHVGQSAFHGHTQEEMYNWWLNSTVTDQLGGRYFRILGYFTSELNDKITYQWRLSYLYIQPPLSTLVYTDVLVGPMMRPNHTDREVDFGIFQLPPWLNGLTSNESLYLRLMATLDDSEVYSNSPIQLDWVCLLPLDSYRYMEPRSKEAEDIFDDGPKGITYLSNVSTSRVEGYLHTMGTPIMLQPGVAQRLYFLTTWANETMDGHINNTLTIRAWYRQRRLIP